jgi:pyruvate dehydrogenase E2 component (dihydrolipoamide acetyltransferase)
VVAFEATGGGAVGMSLLPSGPVAKEEKVRLSNMRQTIARRLLESKTQIPHFYLEVEIDAGPLLDLRGQANAALAGLPKPVKFTVNDFILRACALAMRQAPAVNAAWASDSIIQYAGVHLAFAVAIPDGLITPVIRDAQGKSLKQISDEVKALAGRAREGKLKPDEYTGGTFTVSNLGMLGIDRFCAIINPPQAAILAVGNVIAKPVVDESGAITVGRRMALTLSCDHRVVDGSVGAQFLGALRGVIEKPAALLL